ncbi:MAG TPA: glycoside hydrolase family 6 protein [Pseudonocardiaceae bacterium]|nr:glycoside hydrolase family 6 protein [Pseudonocardiaceae bacterium]
MRRLLVLPTLTALLVCTTAVSATASPGHHDETRLFTPEPTPASITQIEQLAKAGDWHDALLLADMVTTPQAVWLTSGTPAQAQAKVRTTMAEAARQRAVPTLVAYDVPGRDCAQFSAGGALDEASYDAWIDGFAAGLGQRSAIVILEPDALGLLPSSCGLSTTVYPFTDDQRYAELNHAVTALAADRNVSLYLDGTHSAWQSVGTISQRLITAGVQRAKGVFVNVSNYQPTPELVDYGTWISDCIAIVTDTANPLFGNPSACASQYFPATQSDFSTWGLTTQWYAQHLGTSMPTTHFVIDTSRNGNGPNAMTRFATAPFNQPASVISTLAGGSWCNPPGAGLGLRPTTRTGTPLLDADLWVKTPGQSDGQCDAAGGVRAWDYSLYTLPSWPTDPAAQRLFDPLWGTNDPAAGAWFPQQAMQLAQDAMPSQR